MKKSQILLITVMMLATVMTIILAVSFQSVTETQITKLEEDNQRALAAAESAIEALINEKTNQVYFGSGSLANFSEFTGGAILQNAQTKEFTTPLLKKDSSYTFYLAPYNKENNTFGQSINSSLEICFSSSQAIEITLLKNDAIKKYVADPTGNITNASLPSTLCSNNAYQRSYTIPASDISTNTTILVIKNLFTDGRLYFKSNVNLPSQGKTISSQAITSSGVSKKITLFQSYPQIPADFFYTRF